MSGENNEGLVTTLANDSLSGKLTRRNFITYTLAAGFTMTAASSLWTSEVMAKTPKRGGTFRVGVNDANTSDSMDPGKYAGVAEVQLTHTHRSYLTMVESDNTLGPDMAVSWEGLDGAKKWVIKLHENITFHSGKAFTAKDAIASLNHHRGEKSTSSAKVLLDAVQDIKADGDHTIIIDLSIGVADLPWVLNDYHFAMLPANDDGTIDWQSQDGAGPYKIVSHSPGVSTEMVRHEAWHGKGAYFDAVHFIYLNDPNARQTALMTGDIDSMLNVDTKTYNLLKRNKNIVINNTPSGSSITLPMFADQKPFDDVNVRLALKYAIDREEIVKKISYGNATVGNDVQISSNMPYYAELEQRPYDLDKAKFHLKKAGHSSLNIDLSASDSVLPGAVDMCSLYAQQAKPAGINLNVVREPADGYWSNVWMKKPFVFTKWGPRQTPDMIFSVAYAADAAWNDSHWKNARFNKLLVAARAELDNAKRTEMYYEMQVLAKDEGSTILPMFVNYVDAHSSKVHHGPIASDWDNDGGRAAQRWWFA
ncbi:MAG: peptide/nickel transport system substrate-binding protein [Desulforhopalus sp.]|jgi:peptide/nickel transport system substrate-binding protein